MKQSSTLFLKAVVFAIGIAVLILCVIVLPNAMKEGVGMYHPILLGMYVPAIPFFIALHQSIMLLRYIDKNKAFSDLSAKALRNIKFCAIAIGTLYSAGMPYIYFVAEKDDAPGVIVIGLVFIFASFVIATFAAVLQKLLQNAIDIKVENDLTV